MNSALSGFLAEMQAQPWVMEPKALESFLARIASAPEPMIETAFGASPVSSRMRIEGDVAVIPVSGPLMKRVPNIVRWLGFDATSYEDISEGIKAALDSDATTIRLDVDSPGGAVPGVKEAADAIFEASKTKSVTARVPDLAASGAYWLASQANVIEAGPNAAVGSIGVYTVAVDASKMAEKEGVKVHVIRSGEHKGMGVFGAEVTEAQIAGMQKLMDGIAANFQVDVARGRKAKVETVEGWADGRILIAAEAKAIGMIDTVRSGQGSDGNAPPGASAAEESHHEGDESMTTPNPQAAADAALRAQAATEARDSERALEKSRVTALKAAFPKDPAFALAQIEAGVTVEQAKAAYSDVLSERLEKSESARVEAEKKAVKPASVSGAEPIRVDGEPGAGGSGEDFLARARAHAKENKVGLVAAMSAVARENPDIHAAYIEKQRGLAPEVHARKKALGMA